MRLTATMKVPLAIPLATITCCQSGSVSKLGVVGLGADRGRVDEHLGAGEAVGAGELREPLVPAGRQAELGLAERRAPGRRRRRPGPGRK